MAGRSLTVRHGKGGKARRIPLHSEAQALLKPYLDQVRCPDGFPEIGSDQEREPLLVGLRVAVSGQPMQAGIQTRVVRKRVKRLGQAAADQLEALANQAKDEAQALLFEIDPHELVLAPAASETVQVKIAPRRPHWIGVEKLHPVTIVAESNKALPQSIPVHFKQRAWFPTWLPMLLMFLPKRANCPVGNILLRKSIGNSVFKTRT